MLVKMNQLSRIMFHTKRFIFPGDSVVAVQEVDGPADEDSGRVQPLLHQMRQAQRVQEAFGRFIQILSC